MMTLMRMSRYAACLAAGGGLVMATPSASADMRDSETYRCTTASGQFDGAVFEFEDTAATISGKISVHSADVGPQWASLAKILSHKHGARYSDDDCGCNGITVYAFPNPDHLEFDMTANGKDVPLGQAPFDTPITFKISISPQGVMTVALGSTNPKVTTVTLRHPEHDTMELTCSGADVSFLSMATL